MTTFLDKAGDRLESVEKKFHGLEGELKVAQRRYLARRKEAFKANEQKEARRKTADKLRKEDRLEAARKVDREAGRFKSKAHTAHDKAEYWLGEIKPLQQKIHKLETNREVIRQNIDKYERTHGAHVNGNKVDGGTERQQLKLALETAAYNCSHGHQHNFYSQGGYWDIKHCIAGMPYSARFDCSSFATGIHWSCGLADPNGQEFTAGYTGTLMDHCEKISKSEAQVGDFVIYGSYPGHHVEVVLDPSHEVTIGHGSAPVDKGVYNLFGDGDYGFYRNPVLKGK